MNQMEPKNDIKSVISLQKLILSQFPESVPNEEDKESTETNISEIEYEFKPLPKFKPKHTWYIQTIGYLSDIGVKAIFIVDPKDVEPNYFDNNMSDDLKTVLDRKGLKVLLRFSYISDVNSETQKDSLPEHLCIECNNQKIFSYEEGSEDMSGPFDLSDYCNFNQNSVKLFMSKENYIFLLPCIYEISIVSYETCDSFLTKLKGNSSQFLSSDSTKQMITSRCEESTQDEISCITSELRLRLICPLSLRRMETPCRTSECTHIECFDALTFFEANESRYDWFCPICRKSAEFDELRIDGYITEVLNSVDDNITEISIKSDATYDDFQKTKRVRNV